MNKKKNIAFNFGENWRCFSGAGKKSRKTLAVFLKSRIMSYKGG